MATWTTIADGAVDVGSPIDEALMTALRDNVTALAEGASGAPRIVSAALGTDVGHWHVQYNSLLNNDASAIFTQLDTDDVGYLFLLDHVLPATNSTNLILDLSTDNGGSWVAGTGYQYALRTFDSGGGSTGSATAAGTSQFLLATSLSNGAGRGVSGWVLITGLHDAKWTQVVADLMSSSSATGTERIHFGGMYIATTSFNAARFRMNSGNLASGRIRAGKIKAG